MTYKIYFAGSIRGGRQDVAIYHSIIAKLRSYGQVLTEFVGDEKVTDEPQLLKSKGLTEKWIHDSDLTMLKECDYLVAEVTQPSLGVGYEVGVANTLNKKILCLFRPESGNHLSAMIKGAENDSNFTVIEYSSTDDNCEIEGILESYFAS